MKELHVAGVVVHAAPARLDEVRRTLSALPGVEVHAASPAGKLIVTIEADSSADGMSLLGSIHRLDGVLSAALVYQHHEDAAGLDEEVSYEHHAPGFH
jgi:periplasmic nitrate reductase NapD